MVPRRNHLLPGPPMRSARDLDAEIADAIRTSNGTRADRPCPVDIIARDEAERDYLVAGLRGRHHAKGVGVRLETDRDRVLRHARTT